MPAFALANSGVNLRGLGVAQLAGPVAIGTAVALVAGKVVGISSLTWAAVKAGIAPMPGSALLSKLLGVSAVAGIGFTVALFIAGLAFPGHPELLDQAKVGILAGSLVAGCAAPSGCASRAPSPLPRRPGWRGRRASRADRLHGEARHGPPCLELAARRGALTTERARPDPAKQDQLKVPSPR